MFFNHSFTKKQSQYQLFQIQRTLILVMLTISLASITKLFSEVELTSEMPFNPKLNEAIQRLKYKLIEDNINHIAFVTLTTS